jgi:hypothetical protein
VAPRATTPRTASLHDLKNLSVETRSNRNHITGVNVTQAPRRTFPILTEPRRYRLERGITLSLAAFEAGTSMARASEIERYPERARPGELEALRRAADSLAAKGSDGRGEAAP